MNGMFELSDITAITAAQNMVCLKETDADQLFDKRVPLALKTRLIRIWEGLLEHREGPALSKGKCGVALLEIARHLSPEWFELIFSTGFATGRQSCDAVDIG